MLLGKHLLDELDVKKNMRIVDFGSGVAGLPFIINEHYPDINLELVFVDINEEIIKRIKSEILEVEKRQTSKEKANTFLAIWTDLNMRQSTELEAHSVDRIVIENTFNYIKNKKTMLQEMRRILKIGGKILFVDQHTSFTKSVFLQQLLSRKHLVEKAFEQAGFLVYPIKITDSHSYAFIAEKANKIQIN